MSIVSQFNLYITCVGTCILKLEVELTPALWFCRLQFWPGRVDVSVLDNLQQYELSIFAPLGPSIPVFYDCKGAR
jgi:hypothetical protein